MTIRNELINEICAERNIKVEYLSKDYILQLTKDNQSRHIFGPYWGINSATADRLACDKAGCYTILNLCQVPAIEHIIMYNPIRWGYLLDNDGTMINALAYLEKHGHVVVKPNCGAQGRDVCFCKTPLELEQAMHKIFLTEPDIALCPYYEIHTEYRVFFLNGHVHYIYGKVKGENGKHNLSLGARAFELNDKELQVRLAELAIQAANSININFATIDIAALDNNDLAVLEINSGVQAQILLEQMPHLRGIIKAMYAEAVEGMFG